MIEINAANYRERVLKSDLPVLLDIYADWCMPCKLLTPLLEDIAKDYEGKIVFGKLNTVDEANFPILHDYAISSLPTMLFFNNGELVEQFTGLRKEHDIRQVLDDMLF